MEQKRISIVSAPFGLGSSRPGTELGPESMKAAGLLRQIKQLGFEVTGEHTVHEPKAASSEAGASSRIKHLDAVRAMSRRVADHVSDAVREGSFPLVIGGDQSVSIGAFAGLTKHYERLGAICFTAYGGLLDEASSPTGDANGMPLAIALGKAGFKLTDAIEGARLLNKDNLVLIGVRHLEPEEREIIRSEGIAFFSMYDIDKLGIERVIQKAMDIAGNGTDGIHLSVSADGLDPLEAPGVGFPIPGGLSYREAHFACELLAETGKITSMDVAEVNASQDENRRTARLAVGLVMSALGKRII
ncbi:arginase [Paenibacillus sp.]|uniref:arginase n=1 Tax=Paenibacillus sp. TaxID=58172 RepID=UPI002D65FD65|nr:arginase [Paenibacillus sp.]HZG56712.1 arginase [Paenibacillus sp.]